MLFKPTARFKKQVLADDPPMRARVFRALKKLQRNPWSKSVNLEPFKGRPGFWTARVTKGWRFLLREVSADDAANRVFEIIQYASHDDTYGR